MTAWVLALPGGLAYVVSSDEEESSGIVHATLDQVVHFWAPLHDADLVLVAT